MKKLFLGAAVALMLVAASCSKTDQAADSQFFSKQATDSLLMSFGQVAGAALNMQITNAMAADSTISKEEFLKGLQYAMACDTTEAYMNGVIVGMQIQNKIKQFRDMGVDVEPRVVLNSFKKAFMADSVASQMDMTMYNQQYSVWNDSLTAAKRNHELAVLEASPESQENIAKGEAYLKDLTSKDDAVKVTESGLGYKIENAGEGEKVEPNQRVVINYTAKTIDGRVIENYKETPMMLAARTKALREGASMLGKGGKATLYAPGKLTYGVEVPQRLGIGPNEFIIYEVEIVDIPAAVGASLNK